MLWLAGCGDASAPVDASGTSDLGVSGDLEPAAPTMLAPARTLTACLAVDGNNVYWADGDNGGAILKVPLNGGTATPVVTGVDERTCVTTLGDGNIYYSTASTDADLGTGDTIWRAAVGADGGAPQPILQGQHVLNGRLAPGAPYLYWATDQPTPGDAGVPGKEVIVRLSTASKAVEVLIPDVSPPAGDVIVQGADVYWADRAGVFSRPIAMPTQPSIGYGMSSIGPTKLATDGTNVAVIEVAGPSMGDLALFKKDGSGKLVLSTTLVSSPLAVDDKGVYAKVENHLQRFALDGKSAKVLAVTAPRALALDATSIYFTDGTAILKLPR